VSEPSINTNMFPKSGTLPTAAMVRRKAGENRGAVFYVESSNELAIAPVIEENIQRSNTEPPPGFRTSQ